MNCLIFFVFIPACNASLDSRIPHPFKFYGPPVVRRYPLPLTKTYTPDELRILKLRLQRPMVKKNVPDSLAVHPVHDYINNVPVEARLHIIDFLLSQKVRKRGSIFLFGSLDFATPYKQYLTRLSFIDACVLRSLTNAMTRGNVPAVDGVAIIEFFKNKYPDGRFSYLTLEYIHDWLPLIGSSFFAADIRVQHEIFELQKSRGVSKFCGTEKFLLDLVGFERRHMLKSRRDRILLTGYDFV